jgi:hypothetical protein
MVADLERLLTNEPSWPWRTQSAKTVWAAADKIASKNPSLKARDIIRDAFMQTEVPSAELTPEDMALLPTAVRWRLLTVQKPPIEKRLAKTVERMTMKRGL